ncbi:glutamate racemase [Ornithinimicrobium panacihumi]|uniref:glutamate racemase n=1 Tax=Ornithinimicrobium panacihumi TaxID=2008449 RepID=UPI003F89650F
MVDAPIGVFDSGFGGLTVAREILDQLPHESVLYLGDTARTPYGPRPIAEVRQFALECLDRLVDHGVKALVIACNSASAAVLADARERYSVPVVEVIRPAVRRAMAVTRSGRIGVISTAATHQSRAYLDAFVAAPPEVTVTSAACPRFVELVEAGITSGPEVVEVARDYLFPLQDAGIDTLILGCTHYPLLTSALQYVLGEEVSLVTSSAATAAELFRVLTDGDLLAPQDSEPVHQWLTTGDPHGFTFLARRFLGPEVEQVHQAFVGRDEEKVAGAL